MCGHDWCSVRISKEIAEFTSGKAAGFERAAVVKSAALTPEQRDVLEKRGVLSPEEIHRLASKTRKAVGADKGAKAACHSDFADGDQAEHLQAAKLVKLRVKERAADAE
jgi:phosphomethylpyrimidine synthase